MTARRPATEELHPRDRFITIYGRKPVLEALEDASLTVDKVVLAHGEKGELVRAIEAAARARGVTVKWASAQAVNRLSRNARQDQGVVADLVAPQQLSLETALDRVGPRATWLLVDGITTPANVGMLIRGATAAGVDGIVLPRTGSPGVEPQVVKASAGVALRAPLVKCATAGEAAAALATAGFTLVGLRGRDAEDLYTAQLPPRVALVLGNESTGVSPPVAAHVRRWLGIPMAAGVESLNAAMAGVVVTYELYRRQRAPG